MKVQTCAGRRFFAAAMLATLLASPAFAQSKSPDSKRPDGPPAVRDVKVPTDENGSFVQISGRCNPENEKAPNGELSFRWPASRATGVHFTNCRIAIAGARIVGDQVQVRGLKRSTEDFFQINESGDAVEFSTHASTATVRLPLAATGKESPQVRIAIETAAGDTAFQFALTRNGLSEKPDAPKEKKERKPKKAK